MKIVTDEADWSYEPSRVEAILHVVGWALFVVLVAVGVASRFSPRLFGIAAIPGIGWVLVLGAQGLAAMTRLDAWGFSFGVESASARRRQTIEGYLIRPWNVRRSWRIAMGRPLG